jgi:hypothetical protein
MGKPDEIHCPITTSNGDVLDIWEYSLATIDENQHTRRAAVAFGCFLLWPLLPIGLIALACMESEYSYDNYFLKFVNNLLTQWGRRADVFPVQMNR